MATHEPPSKDLSGSLEVLSDVIAAVDIDLANTCKLLNKKIKLWSSDSELRPSRP